MAFQDFKSYCETLSNQGRFDEVFKVISAYCHENRIGKAPEYYSLVREFIEGVAKHGEFRRRVIVFIQHIEDFAIPYNEKASKHSDLCVSALNPSILAQEHERRFRDSPYTEEVRKFAKNKADSNCSLSFAPLTHDFHQVIDFIIDKSQNLYALLSKAMGIFSTFSKNTGCNLENYGKRWVVSEVRTGRVIPKENMRSSFNELNFQEGDNFIAVPLDNKSGYKLILGGLLAIPAFFLGCFLNLHSSYIKNVPTGKYIKEAKEIIMQHNLDKIKPFLRVVPFVLLMGIVWWIIPIPPPYPPEPHPRPKPEGFKPFVATVEKIDREIPELKLERKRDMPVLVSGGECIKDSSIFYYVNVVNPTNEETIRFPIYEYSLKPEVFGKSSLDSAFTKMASMMKELEKDYNFNFYLLGGADAGSKTQALKSQNLTPEIFYLPKDKKPNPAHMDDICYTTSPKPKQIPQKYFNEHLPYLRAFWVQKRLKNAFIDIPIATIDILEGEVKDIVKEDYRRVVIILIACKK
jgi:hypothetical protein